MLTKLPKIFGLAINTQHHTLPSEMSCACIIAESTVTLWIECVACFTISKMQMAERHTFISCLTGKRPPITLFYTMDMFLLSQILKCENTHLKINETCHLNSKYHLLLFFILVFHINKS